MTLQEAFTSGGPSITIGTEQRHTISLLKEYKREVALYLEDRGLNYPPMPSNYLSIQNQAILNEYRANLDAGTHRACVPKILG